jgi:hypothetical protein
MQEKLTKITFFLLLMADGMNIDMRRRVFVYLSQCHYYKAHLFAENNFLLKSVFLGKWIIFQCLVVSWKISWKTISSVWLCHEK